MSPCRAARLLWPFPSLPHSAASRHQSGAGAAGRCLRAHRSRHGGGGRHWPEDGDCRSRAPASLGGSFLGAPRCTARPSCVPEAPLICSTPPSPGGVPRRLPRAPPHASSRARGLQPHPCRPRRTRHRCLLAH
eukprot:scaffold14224_cov96-Isochrysis_galbana.AAC.6